MIASRLVLQRVMAYPDVREGGSTRECKRHVKRSNYLQGKCRKVYKLNVLLD